MKRLILTALAASFGFSLFAQGTVDMGNHPGVMVIHVYGPLPSDPHISQIGNGPNDYPPGTTSWAGFPGIGAVGGLAGSSTYAQLLGAPGYNMPESSLVPAQPATTFRTGAAGGTFANTIATFSNILPDAPQATLELVSWDNSSGLYPTWAQASAAWLGGVLLAGKTGTWNQNNIGGIVNLAPPMINSTDPTQHARSFNLYLAPEPTTAALGGLGATALLILRRRR